MWAILIIDQKFSRTRMPSISIARTNGTKLENSNIKNKAQEISKTNEHRVVAHKQEWQHSLKSSRNQMIRQILTNLE